MMQGPVSCPAKGRLVDQFHSTLEQFKRYTFPEADDLAGLAGLALYSDKLGCCKDGRFYFRNTTELLLFGIAERMRVRLPLGGARSIS